MIFYFFIFYQLEPAPHSPLYLFLMAHMHLAQVLLWLGCLLITSRHYVIHPVQLLGMLLHILCYSAHILCSSAERSPLRLGDAI